MGDLDPYDEGPGGTVFRDVIMLALAGFVAIVIMLLPHINPPGKAEALARPPGNVMVEIVWPEDLDVDVDLWVQAPGDVPVGYSNKSGQIFNLLRDDLGAAGDATNLNYEVSYSRGIAAGEYTVNLHLYRNGSTLTRIPVTVVTSVKSPRTEQTRQILKSDAELTHTGQEITVYRFTLDDGGFLEHGSVHSLFKPLRSGAQS